MPIVTCNVNVEITNLTFFNISEITGSLKDIIGELPGNNRTRRLRWLITEGRRLLHNGDSRYLTTEGLNSSALGADIGDICYDTIGVHTVL